VKTDIAHAIVRTLVEPPDGGDTEHPRVVMQSPRENDAIDLNKLITVSGTAADLGGSGIRDVQARFMLPYPSTVGDPYTLATLTPNPDPTQSSTWTVSLRPTIPEYNSIMAKATDNAGLEGFWRTNIIFNAQPTEPFIAYLTNYHHYITVGGSNSVILVATYNTGGSTTIGKTVRAVMEILDGSTQAIIREVTRDFVVGAGSPELLGMSATLETIDAPGSIRLRHYITDLAGLVITPIRLTPVMALGQHTNTMAPTTLPTVGLPIAMRVIYWHYLRLLSGALQIKTVGRYRADPSIIGQPIRGELAILLPNGLAPVKVVTYPSGIPAAADGVIVMTTGTDTLTSPNPTSIWADTYMINTGDQVISNKHRVRPVEGMIVAPFS
jgi:hypothetical protein